MSLYILLPSSWSMQYKLLDGPRNDVRMMKLLWIVDCCGTMRRLLGSALSCSQTQGLRSCRGTRTLAQMPPPFLQGTPRGRQQGSLISSPKS